MNSLSNPAIFFRFADSAIDPTPNYNAPNSERIELGLSAFWGPKRRNALLDLEICLREMLDGRFTDEELNRFWSSSRTNIKHVNPKLTRALLDEALATVERQLNQ
jgi:hypothetical protein